MILADKICGESPAGHRRSWPTGSMSPANPVPSGRAPSPSRRRRKLLQMSRFFRVSTDYLLKDELERPEKIDGPTPPPQPIPSDEPAPDPRPLRRVSREPPKPDCALCWWPWRCSYPAAKGSTPF